MNEDTPKNNPEEIEARITAMLLGELTLAEEAEVRRALESNPDWARLHERLKHAIQLVRETVAQPAEAAVVQQSQPRMSEERRQKLLQQFKTVTPKELSPPRRRGVPWFVPMSIAAALMALLTLGGLVSWDEFSGYEPKAWLFPRALAKRQLSEERLDQLRSRIAGDTKGESAGPKIVPSPRSRMRRNASDAKGESLSRSSGAEQVGRSKVASTPQPANRVAPRLIYLPGQTDADKAVEVAQNLRLLEESGIVFGGSGRSVADNAAAKPDSLTAAPATIPNLGDNSQLGWMFAAPPSVPELAPGQSDKTGSLPLDALALVDGTSADANSQPGPRANFALASPSPVAWGDYNNDGELARQNLSLAATSPAPLKDAAEFDFTKTPAVLTTAQSAPAPLANAPPGRAEIVQLSLDEPALRKQMGAPAGGASDSALGESLEAENPKQDGLGQSVAAGKPTEGSIASSSSPEKEAPRPSFMDPRMMARYFGGKMPAGSPGVQAGGTAGSLEKMTEEKGVLAEPTIRAIGDQVTGVDAREGLARLNREQEQIGNTFEKPKALEQGPDKVDFANTLSSEGKNVTQLGEPEKDKLAEQRLAEVELRADPQPSSTSNKSDFYSLSLAKEAKQLEKEHKRAYASNASLMDVIQPDSARAVSRPLPPEPQPDVPTQENAFSTFSLNVTDVSFKLAAASLEKGALPEPATVRSEEFINAFNYRDPEPAPGAPVAFAWERAQYPYAHNRELIRFAVRTAARGREAGRPLNLVLLLDNSGSMERADRVRIIREALVVLARQLQPYDRISVVAFARTARLWVDALPGNQAGELAERVGNLPPDGGTNLEEALNLAYATAASHFLSQGVNRVVLLTDGAANLGDVDPESLRRKVESWRQRGVALDCFGIGWEGYNDDLLEVLSRNGDGRYGFVNTPQEATTEFAAQLAGALQVAASDVKVQVEFNPRRVEAWRQIGYAKHQLTKKQFRDNTVDAAELAAAESGNALYVIQVNPNGVGPIGTVRVRYREPGSGYYREHEWPVPHTGAALPLDRANASLRLAATASAFSEWLVSSPFAGEVTPDRLLNYLQGVPAAFEPDPRPQKLEWMIRQAKSISGK